MFLQKGKGTDVIVVANALEFDSGERKQHVAVTAKRSRFEMTLIELGTL